jgi:hypothetical protein
MNNEWHSADTKPDPGKKVLVHYRNELGKDRIVVGFWVPDRWKEATSDDELDCVYDEETDTDFWPEGWYEAIDNWDDYSAVVINHPVLHWMPLPSLPTGEDK